MSQSQPIAQSPMGGYVPNLDFPRLTFITSSSPYLRLSTTATTLNLAFTN